MKLLVSYLMQLRNNFTNEQYHIYISVLLLEIFKSYFFLKYNTYNAILQN